MPPTVTPMDAEKDDITLRKHFDPIPYPFNDADMLIASTSRIICSAKVIHQRMPLGAVGHARIEGANLYLCRAWSWWRSQIKKSHFTSCRKLYTNILHYFNLLIEPCEGLNLVQGWARFSFEDGSAFNCWSYSSGNFARCILLIRRQFLSLRKQRC